MFLPKSCPYRIKRGIGDGGFSKLFVAEDLSTHSDVALKIALNPSEIGHLNQEANVYQRIRGIGIPQFHTFTQTDESSILAIELLGKSLQELFTECNHKFSIKTMLMITDQMISRLEELHCFGWVHSDIKPQNFAIGLLSKSNIIYLIDYGLSTPYIDLSTKQHLKIQKNDHFFGTSNFASLSAHQCTTLSRRDDLQSLFYTLIFLFKGGLPWSKKIAEIDTQGRNAIISSSKRSHSLEDLCKDLPKPFLDFGNLVFQLKFDEKPNYSGYRTLFRDYLIKIGETYDYRYDWIEKKQSTSQFQFQFGQKPETSIKSEDDLPKNAKNRKCSAKGKLGQIPTAFSKGSFLPLPMGIPTKSQLSPSKQFSGRSNPIH